MMSEVNSPRYVILIPEGAADEPADLLDRLTPLEAARTPHLDALCRQGRVGLVATVPPGGSPGWPASEEVTLPCLLGYDPMRLPLGRAGLDTRGLRLPIQCHRDEADDDNETQRFPAIAARTLFRVDFLTLDDDGTHIVSAADKLTIPQTRQLLADIERAVRERSSEFPGFAFTVLEPGAGLLSADFDADDDETICHPLGTVLDRPLRRCWPVGPCAEPLKRLMLLSRDVLAEHEINDVRSEVGEPPIDMLWVWGTTTDRTSGRIAGDAEGLPPFWLMYGPDENGHLDATAGSGGSDGAFRGRIIADLPAAIGLGDLMGFQTRLELTQNPDRIADLAAMFIDDLEEWTISVLYLSTMDRSARNRDPVEKMERIEKFDELVVGPIHAAIESHPRWRMLIAPSRRRLSTTGACDGSPVPFVMAGFGVTSIVERRLTERDAVESDLFVEVGHELMEFVLYGSGMRNRFL